MKEKKKKITFKHIFIPHIHNEYRPHAFRHRLLVLYSFILLSSQLLFNVAYVSGPSLVSQDLTVMRNTIVTQTNVEREKVGLKRLNDSSQLDLAARSKLEDMFSKGYWDHKAPDGTEAWSFLAKQDYSYIYAGENLAKGFLNGESTVKAWMDSPTHRKNILNDKYFDIGVAVGQGTFNDRPTIFVVQIFAAPETLIAAEKTNKIESVSDISDTKLTLGSENITIVSRLPYFLIWLFIFVLIIFDGVMIRRLGLHKSRRHIFQFRAALLVNIFALVLLSLNYVSIA